VGSEVLAENDVTFSDREVIKECWEAGADVAFPDKSTSFVTYVYQDLTLEEK
jgi:hypothetical protein